jgi:hypothetical protein
MDSCADDADKTGKRNVSLCMLCDEESPWNLRLIHPEFQSVKRDGDRPAGVRIRIGPAFPRSRIKFVESPQVLRILFANSGQRRNLNTSSAQSSERFLEVGKILRS